ncbi:MAG TPA: CHAT domain-containing protein, partial [Cyanophyceae cyanobacterium]
MLYRFVVRLTCDRSKKKKAYHLSQGIIGFNVLLSCIIVGYVNPGQAASREQSKSFHTFTEWCLNKDTLSDEARYTVGALLEKAATFNCDEANEILSNLTGLDLSRNRISELSPLASLKNLTYLYLGNHEISDFTPLKYLTKLTFLELRTNNTPKICPVSPDTICHFSDEGETPYEQGQQQYFQGQFQLALVSFQNALAIYQKIGDRVREGNGLNQIGNTYSNLGHYAQALDFYQQALVIRKDFGDRPGQNDTLTGLGIVYERLGQYQKATQILDKIPSEIFKDIWKFYPNTLDNFDLTSSINFFHNPAARPSYVMAWCERTNLAFNTLSSIHIKIGKYAEALNWARLALACTRKDGPEAGKLAQFDTNWIYQEARNLDTVGVAYLRVGNRKRALTFLQRALERMREIGNEAGEGRVLNHLGELYFNQKQTQKALEFYQQALPLRQAANDIAGQGETLNNLGLLYFNQNQYPEAEKYLFDAINVLEALRPGLKDDEKIAIFETQTVTYRLLQKALIAQNKYNQALEISDRARARAFVELLAQRFTDTQDEQIAPLNLEQIQRIAKEQNATLVEYSLVYDDFNVNGKQQPEESELYIWVIQPSGEIAFRRTNLKLLWQEENTSLDTIVANTRCFDNLACRQNLVASRGVGNIPEVRNQRNPSFNLPEQERSLAVQSRTQTEGRQLQQLHQLLIEPIADLLPTEPNARIIFIPQRSLFLTPFPALQDEKGNYLIEKHTILTAPSIQVLNLTHQKRQNISPSIKNALVVGNPTMPKISPSFGEQALQLSPLPGAEKEADDIAKILNTQPLKGDQATESVVVKKMSQARIIHLATHGSFDPERGIGSWVALAPSGQQDGLLKAEEIVDLKLNAELTVLSACETGQGKITGDGVVGLSRSLISAGVPSVMVSLWKVPDQ